MPELNLWVNVIIQSIKDYRDFARNGYGGESEGGSAEWFLFKERGGMFEHVCRLVGMDADRARMEIFNNPEQVMKNLRSASA